MASCKIVIKDECTCQITGLDLPTRRKLVTKFSYDIPGARFIPAVRLGRWDGKKNFFTLSGQTYVNLLAEILPIIEYDGYDIELHDLRDYNTTFEFEAVTESSYAHKVWPKGHDREGQPIMLRDYQVAAINDFLLNVQSLGCLSTSSGKTIITGVLSHKVETYGRSIIIVPSTDLVKQTEADYINMGLDVGVFHGAKKDFTKTHTICTWQSLNSLIKKSKEGEALISITDFLEGVICVIADECHIAKASILLEMLTGVMSKIPIRWGVTGTIPKEMVDRLSLKVSLGEVVSTVKASDLQELGVLSNCHVHVKQLIDYGDYKAYQDELKYLLDSKNRLAYIASVITEISKTGNTLVLIGRVDPGKELASAIPGAIFLSGSTKSDVRKENYDSIATNNNITLVCTYGIASTGINIPRIFNLVFIEAGKSFVRVIQSIGRGLRKTEDKDFVEIYDITSTCKFSKRHLTERKKFYTEANYPFSIEKVDWQK
jgi:superfamily II DNA or RNA helicase